MMIIFTECSATSSRTRCAKCPGDNSAASICCTKICPALEVLEVEADLLGAAKQQPQLSVKHEHRNILAAAHRCDGKLHE